MNEKIKLAKNKTLRLFYVLMAVVMVMVAAPAAAAMADEFEGYILSGSTSILVDEHLAKYVRVDSIIYLGEGYVVVPVGTTLSFIGSTHLPIEVYSMPDYRGWITWLFIGSQVGDTFVFENTEGYRLQVGGFTDGSPDLLDVRVTPAEAQTPTPITAPAPAPTNGISVTVNGTAVNFAGTQPTIVGGRTLVPVRGVFETLGFDVSWNSETRQATLSRTNDTVVITIDSATFTANGANHTLDVPAQIIGGSTMLPIRAVLESVGYELDWNGDSQTVIISTN